MAFPTTPILDTFNRADENPATGFTSVLNNIQVLSNQAGATSANHLVYYSASTYGPDSECLLDLPTKPPGTSQCSVGARWVQVGSPSTLDGYSLVLTAAAGTDSFAIQRVDNGVGTTLGSAISQEVTNGDGMGIRCLGSVIYGFYRSGAGEWTELGNRSDSTYTAAGNIGLSGNSTTTRYDNFGGGTFIPLGTRLTKGTKLHKMSLVA